MRAMRPSYSLDMPDKQNTQNLRLPHTRFPGLAFPRRQSCPRIYWHDSPSCANIMLRGFEASNRSVGRKERAMAMGFLSRLFGRSRPQSSSLVVRWVKQRLDELAHEKDVTPDAMFAGFMYTVSTFGMADQEISKDMQAFGAEWEAHNVNDSELFELGCYVFAYIDIWLLQKDRDLHERISQVFVRDFVRLFTEVLQTNNVAELFGQRVRKYAELILSGADSQRHLYYLVQLVIRSRDNLKPEPYDFGDEPVIIVGILENYQLTSTLMAWEKGMLPALIKSMEKLTAMMK